MDVQAFNDPTVRQDVLTSIKVAPRSTVISLFIAVTGSLWARRASHRSRRLFDALAYSRIVLPEVVFALGLLVLFGKLHIPSASARSSSGMSSSTPPMRR